MDGYTLIVFDNYDFDFNFYFYGSITFELFKKIFSYLR